MTDARIFEQTERLTNRARDIRDQFLSDHGPCSRRSRAAVLMECDRLVSLAFADLAKMQRTIRAELDGHEPGPAVTAMLSASIWGPDSVSVSVSPAVRERESNHGSS